MSMKTFCFFFFFFLYWGSQFLEITKKIISQKCCCLTTCTDVPDTERLCSASTYTPNLPPAGGISTEQEAISELSLLTSNIVEEHSSYLSTLISNSL